MGEMGNTLDPLDLVGACILIIDIEEDSIIFANKAAREFFPPEKTLSKLLQDQHIELINLYYENQSDKTIEIQYINKTRKRIYSLSISVNKISLPQSPKIYPIFTIQCIPTPTDLHRANHVLEKISNRYTLINLKNKKQPRVMLQQGCNVNNSQANLYLQDNETLRHFEQFISNNTEETRFIKERTTTFTPATAGPSPQKSRHSLPEVVFPVGKNKLLNINSGDTVNYCEITMTKLTDPITNDPCILIYEKDVTEQKLIEKQFTLEMRKKNATSEFIGNLSHEIRTPLNGIHGMLQYLTETKLSYDQKASVTVATSSTVALTNLLTDVLDFSKVEAGKLSIRAAPITIRDLISLLEEICHLFGNSVVSKGIRLFVEYPPEFLFSGVAGKCNHDQKLFPRDHNLLPQYIISDIMRIRQILINLISNAIKYTTAGYVCVKLRVLSSSLDSHGLPFRIEVKDTGEGIDTTNRNSIFARFQRFPGLQGGVDAPERPEGTGIGLAIGEQLTQLLGGELLLESVLGEGSTFTLCLPRTTNVEPEQAERSGRKSRTSSAPHITFFPEILERKREKQEITIGIQDLHSIVQKTSFQIISPHSDMIYTNSTASFFRRLHLYSCNMFDSIENITKPNAKKGVDIYYILDIGGFIRAPQFDAAASKSNTHDAEHDWVDEVQNLIVSLYNNIFTLYSTEPTVSDYSSCEPLPTHPVNNAKLVVLIPLSCASVLSHVTSKIPWFTCWLASPLVPSSVISLLSGKRTNEIQPPNESPELSERRKKEPEEIKAYRVLVAEDNSANRLVFNRLLNNIRSDIHIEWAKTGTEAVHKYAASLTGIPFDICFMDLEMPKMDGLDAAKSIRELERLHGVMHGIPIIAVTANDTADLSVRTVCKRAGMNDELSKPINKNVLRKILSSWLPL